MEIFVGLDGGGSKTLCVVADGTGHVLGAGRGGPINVNFVSEEVARTSLRDAMQGAWQAAGSPPAPPKVIGVTGPIPPLLSEVVGEIFGGGKIVGVPEGRAPWEAMRPWLDSDCGITVDAGTGSLAFGIGCDGRTLHAGGWGSLLGDEGSGYWIGFQGILAAIRASDGREPPTSLGEAICRALGIKTLRGLVPLFYRRGVARHEVAALCPVVARVAMEGDAKAQAIFAAAGRELALMAEAVARRLGVADEEVVIVPFGSVFKVGDLLLRPFTEAIRKSLPKARIVLPRYESAVGALLVAMRSGGVQVDDILERLGKELDATPMVRVIIDSKCEEA